MTDVKKLLAEATPLPWAAIPHRDSPLGGATVTQHARSLSNGTPVLGDEVAETITEQDAVLIVHAINHLSDYEAAADALWRLRVHELNADGSPCWCNLETEPDVHGEDCQRARDALRAVWGAA